MEKSHEIYQCSRVGSNIAGSGGHSAAGLGFGSVVAGTFGLVFKVIGTLLLVTGLVGYCPVYALLKVRTKK
ncbi:MAG: YgaP family membrane protein [Bellilinea sp.]